ncbi:DCC1-like thiol-disulfide oxidoreductase family protein [Lysinibacillus telephonicus]|uniref:DUF393 domain-containing protein n=1 Tax=Lysinibacillus telephonicus TaxID=1714840 RepID=A0A3S0I441_9BACI|nr:DCC1-like thiol-disulfide oxidoreductase family protein [Lysinibacillus telephonicus]RTQ95835.1 DUF393 domain-containing protein [Lysinibacillus telephonicus]
MSHIILFDGECNFCDQTVLFILKRDRQKHFKFASIQSEIGQELFMNYDIPKTVDSVILIEGNRYFTKSTAVLRICKNLDRLWKMFYFFIIIPAPIRDIAYNFVAKKRYLLGKKNACIIPKKEDLDRFLS